MWRGGSRREHVEPVETIHWVSDDGLPGGYLTSATPTHVGAWVLRDVDIPLTEKGVMEALAGGKAVSHINFDIIFTSRLVRSKQTALIAMTQVNLVRG